MIREAPMRWHRGLLRQCDISPLQCVVHACAQ
jgi:hypothetical protein